MHTWHNLSIALLSSVILTLSLALAGYQMTAMFFGLATGLLAGWSFSANTETL